MTYPISSIIEKLHTSGDCLIQIGANDGIQDDLLRSSIIKFEIDSHLIEPVPYYYNELKSNYNDYKNIKTYNYAISNQDGDIDFSYIYPIDDLPVWAKGLGTFDVTKNFLGNGLSGLNLRDDMSQSDLYQKMKTRIRTSKVKTLKLETFLAKKNISKIDFYVSDTEGHDWIIFNQLNLTKYFPKLILMETHTLVSNDLLQLNTKLKKFKYKIIHQQWDTVAIREDYAASY